MVRFTLVLSALSAMGLVAAGAVPKRDSADPFSGQHSGEGTWFNPALGACGIYNTDADFIAAAGHGLFDTYPGYAGPGTNPNVNPICGKTITASYNGRSVSVAFTDRCVGCNEFDVDLSPGAFQQLADLGVGRMPITWTWN